MKDRIKKDHNTDKPAALVRHILMGFVGASALLLGACTTDEVPEDGTRAPSDINIRDQSSSGAIFGDSGLFADDPYADGRSIGVNSFLWRASLDTISFMPVSSADPFGGVIITDWYSASEAPNERFKLNVYILGRALRADGVRVAVFRQVLDSTSGWRDIGLSDVTATKIEDSILTRARQLRNEVLRIQ
jgi:hypothetical protein